MSTVYIRFATRNSELQRAPVLERLIARAAQSPGTDWRAEAFHAIAAEPTPMPSIGAAALFAAAGVVRGAWVCMATPVHLLAGMSQVSMAQDGILEVNRDTAEALAADFEQVFGETEMRLLTGHAGMLLGAFDRALEVATHDPAVVAGSDVFGFQPGGRDAGRLRLLMSEMEMWLFDHAVNRVRAALSLPAITGLWLWGGGSPLWSLPAVQGWTAGADPLFSAFGVRAQYPQGAGAGVVVCTEHPGSAAWLAAERRWLEPALACLQSGRIDRIVLSVGSRRFHVVKTRGWPFWRRARPWWESLGEVSHGVQ